MSYFRRSRAAYSEFSGGILQKFELLQAFMVILVICKNEEDPIKNEGSRVLTRFPHYKFMGLVKRSRAANSAVCGQIRPTFEIVRALIVVLPTCKTEEDRIKNEGARVLTRFSHYNHVRAKLSVAMEISSDLIGPKT